ncbi:hypothetical protein Spith_1121 [Spirochaeta thermophila DSM 6578]|uniref:Uncharacterized protein n=1 Tax=Winmispira thermophila (strain ATCC 700085 / DSM 6578 / Z-1203) TaxID=869211 RepID=G0GE40_WINT7|nr:hypothetical protein [Spirochaeta thermophila]AEJ61393.1 hypothetical protein Spith_1121 [Spirochaeta thermophila DSM 6578]
MNSSTYETIARKASPPERGKKRRRAGEWTLLLFLLGVYAGCGLETGVILNPIESGHLLYPGEDTKTGFRYDGENSVYEAYFKGVELYYKFYASDISDRQTFFVDDASFTSDKEDIEDILYNPVSSLTSKGYRRVYAEGSEELPLIPFGYPDGTYTVTITVDTSNGISRFDVTGKETKTSTIIRTVENDEPFSSADRDDIDVPNSGTHVYLVFVAVCFGVDDELNNLYSAARVLYPIKVEVQ